MSELITVSGVVLSVMPIGDYDKRVVLLTRERGKITAFARGARRPNSPLLAATNPFVFGTFSLYEGRSSYNLSQAVVKEYFTQLAGKQPEIYYGYYFLELADYFGQEYNDELQMVNLLYVSVKALLRGRMSPGLIRCVYELKAMVIQGVYPQVFSCIRCGKTQQLEFYTGEGCLCRFCREENRQGRPVKQTTIYTMQYIIATPLERLYTFTVTEEVFRELEKIMKGWMEEHVEHRPKSLDVLEIMA